MQVHIRVNDGKTISFEIQSSDTIQNLKSNIQTRTGLDFTQQRLIFEGNELGDNSTLYESKIQDQATLHLVPKKDDMLIFIRTLTGKTWAFDVDQYNTVEEIKAKIEQREGIPVCEQRLVYPGTYLMDSRTIASYCFNDEPLLYLILKFMRG